MLDGLEINAPRAGGGATVVELTGELDFHSAARLYRTLEETPKSSGLVLDLSGLTLIDSSGLAAIIALREDTATAGGRLALVSTSRAINRVFDITSLTDLLDVKTTREQAVRSVKAI